MSKTIKIAESKKQQDTLNTTDKQPLKFEEIKETPFTIVEENGVYYGLLSNYRITENSNDKEKIIEECKEINWNRLIQVMTVIFEKLEKINETIKNNN